jgi:putative ABC transport system ATP-binding protein
VSVGISNQAPVLELRGIHRFYFPGADNEISALKDVSISVEPGEFVAIIGPSGSGKSTLLSIMAGLDQPNGGSVWIDGQRLSHRSRSAQAAWRGSSIGVMTQSSGLLEHLSIGQNVKLGDTLRRRARRDLATVRSSAPGLFAQVPSLSATEILDAVGLGDLRDARPSTLSGGETARANLAVALAGTPRILLADEPTAEISRSEERDILDLISSTRPQSGATVIVTHSESVAAAADRVIEMQDGKVISS